MANRIRKPCFVGNDRMKMPQIHAIIGVWNHCVVTDLWIYKVVKKSRCSVTHQESDLVLSGRMVSIIAGVKTHLSRSHDCKSTTPGSADHRDDGNRHAEPSEEAKSSSTDVAAELFAESDDYSKDQLGTLSKSVRWKLDLIVLPVVSSPKIYESILSPLMDSLSGRPHAFPPIHE